MRQKPVEFLSVLKGQDCQEYEDACQEQAKSLSSDLLKRGTLVKVNGVTYKLSNSNVKDIKACRGGGGKPAKRGLSCLPLLVGVTIFVAFMTVAVWLALGTNSSAWAATATLFGGSLLSTAAARELYQAFSTRNKSEILWKSVVTVGALSAFMGIWAPDFAEKWDEFKESWEMIRKLF